MSALIASVLMCFISSAFSFSTTPNIREVYYGRCYDYLNAHPNSNYSTDYCDNLYASFTSSFFGKDPLTGDISDYKTYIDLALKYSPVNNNTQLFYSHTGQWTGQLTKCNPNYRTIETMLLGYLSNSLEWCSSLNSDTYSDDCPSWGTETVHNIYPAFWAAASKGFAGKAIGQANVLLLGTSSREPYDRNSMFYNYELPNMKSSLITSLNIMLLQELGLERNFTCSSDNIKELFADARKYLGNDTKITCEENPPVILSLLCTNDPDHSACKTGEHFKVAFIATIVTSAVIMVVLVILLIVFVTKWFRIQKL